MTGGNIQTQLTPMPDAEMDALIDKHRTAIDKVLMMDSMQQQQAVRELGVDPNSIKEHYGSFIAKAEELKKLDAAAAPKTAILGWASFGTVAAILIHRRDKIAKSPFVQKAVIILSSMLAGLTGTFIGSRLFAGKIREDSKQLDILAKEALERELAVAFENKERGAAAPSETPTQPLNANLAVSPRNPSFVAQAATDKATLEASTQMR